MRYFLFIITLFTCVCALQAQVIDYDIDSDFDTGSFYQKGSVNSITPISGNDFIITGHFLGLPNTAKGWSIVDASGNNVFNTPTQNFGPGDVQPYLSKYVTNGSQIATVL